MDAHRLAVEIVQTVCELDEIPNPDHDDTICVTVQDLEAVIENRIATALCNAETE